MVHDLAGVGCGAMDAAEHVLRVARVALPPCLIVQLVYQSRAMIALIEGYGDEARSVLACASGPYACVPGGYDGAGNGGHLFGRLEAWMQEP